MKNIFLLAVASLWFSISSFSADNSVRLRGNNFQGFDGKITIYEDCLRRDCSIRLGSFSVKLDNDGRFDTTIVISKPQYYTIDACSIFLIPGGDLEITYNANLKEYSFTGRTASECAFLMNNPLNLYGEFSFLGGGKNIKNTFIKTKKCVDSIASIRVKLLNESKNLDSYFVEIERARTQAHIVNSYINYYMLTPHKVKCYMGDEAKTQEGRKFLESIRKYVEPLTKEFFNERYIANVDIRFIVERCKNGGFITIHKGAIWDQVYSVRDLMDKFSQENGGLDKVVIEAKKLLPILTNSELSAILKNEIYEKDNLASGKVALEFEIEDVNGNKIDLSAYKGRPILIDLWATWCSICIVEMPFFVKLKEKYPNVAFVSISIDENKERWKEYLASKPKNGIPQFVASNKNKFTKTWNVFGVPRYILLDKDFKIVDAYAPHPRMKEVEQLLIRLSN